MKNKYIYLFFILFSLTFILPLIIAPAPTDTVISSNTDIQIITMPFESIRQNTDLYIRFWAFNGSTGSLLKNNSIYCTTNVLEPQGKNIFRVSIPIVNFGIPNNPNGCVNCFWYDISGSNFSKLGIYGLNIRCQTYDNFTLGGDSMIPLTVTYEGLTDPMFFYLIITIIIIGITLFGIAIRNIPTSIIGSLVMISWGIYVYLNGFGTVQNTAIQSISILLIAFGAFWSIKASLEYFDVI